MIDSFESELRELAAVQALGPALSARAIALERRTVFSIFAELRATLYIAVSLIVAGLGIVVRKNLDRIGPVTFIMVLAAAASICYAVVIRAHLQHKQRSIGGDYLLLLGGLLLSADLGYAESEFHVMGAQWSRLLLLLATLHGLAAYWLNSRLLLILAITSLAGWLGIEHAGALWDALAARNVELSLRAWSCAGVLLLWRALHERLQARQPFQEVFEHFIANLSLWAAAIWCTEASMQIAGALTLSVLVALWVRRGMRFGREPFVVYGIAWATLGAGSVLLRNLSSALDRWVALLILTATAAWLLWHLHGRLQERTG